MKEKSRSIFLVLAVIAFIASILVKRPLLQNIVFVLSAFLFIMFYSPKKARLVLIIALSVRLIFVLIDQYVFPLPESREGSDALMFTSMGLEWSKNGLKWLLSHFTSGAFMYSWVIGLIYSIFGTNQFLIQFLNAILGTFIVYNVFLIGDNVLDTQKAVIASIICALFPTSIYFSVLPFREVVIIFFFTLGLLFLIKWIKESKIYYILIAELFFIISFGFHTGMLWAVIFPPFELLFEIFKEPFRKVNSAKVLAFAVLIFMVFVAFKAGFGLEKIPRSNSLSDSLTATAGLQQLAARDRAAYLKGVVPRNFFDFLWQVPLRAIYFLFSPFVWMVKIPLDLLGFFDAVSYVILIIFAGLNFRKIVINKFLLALLLILIGEVVIFSMGTSNYGTALRHRSKFLPIFSILASDEIARFIKNLKLAVRLRK
jgi:4-amino-4-deoxy-L-arabinose transferase-like glycosyltransferase